MSFCLILPQRCIDPEPGLGFDALFMLWLLFPPPRPLLSIGVVHVSDKDAQEIGFSRSRNWSSCCSPTILACIIRLQSSPQSA